MSGFIQISAPQITVNNVSVAIVPNTFSYTEGQGEQTMKTASAGGGEVVPVYADNAETKISQCKFSIFADASLIALALSWKQNRNANVIAAVDTQSPWQRTFQQAALLNDYDVKTGVEGMLELAWKSLPAV